MLLLFALTDITLYPQFALHYKQGKVGHDIELPQVKIKSLMKKYHIEPAPAVSWSRFIKVLFEKDKHTVLYRVGIILGFFLLGIIVGIV